MLSIPPQMLMFVVAKMQAKSPFSCSVGLHHCHCHGEREVSA